MTFRTLAGCAALMLSVLLTWNMPRAVACEGAGCGATPNAKPLNIMQFMREQAASTRVNERSQKVTRATARTHRTPHHTVVARRKPVRMPTEAAASFASQPFLNIEEAPNATGNSTARLTGSLSAETTGMALGSDVPANASDPKVQLVDADEYNEIDRKTDGDVTPSANAIENADASPNSGVANESWLQWIWTSLGNTFAALTTAVHQLIRL